MNLGKETERIEFKKSTSELKQAMNSISAILNKHGEGILYFGVTDFDIEELYAYGTLYKLQSEEDKKGEIFIGLTSLGYYVYDLYMYN